MRKVDDKIALDRYKAVDVLIVRVCSSVRCVNAALDVRAPIRSANAALRVCAFLWDLSVFCVVRCFLGVVFVDGFGILL